jgi:hypothetical protein
MEFACGLLRHNDGCRILAEVPAGWTSAANSRPLSTIISAQAETQKTGAFTCQDSGRNSVGTSVYRLYWSL